MHHTQQELGKIERETGLRMAGTIDMSPGFVPVFLRPDTRHVDDIVGFRPIGGRRDEGGNLPKPVAPDEPEQPPRRVRKIKSTEPAPVVVAPPIEVVSTRVYVKGDPKPLRAEFATRQEHVVELRAWYAAQQL